MFPQPQRNLEAEKLAGIVLELAPQVDRERANTLGANIEKSSKQYNVSPILLAAILRHESNFGVASKRCSYSCDYGIGQINQLWIKELKLDVKRLQHDDAYNIDVSARILAAAKVAGDKKWWSRYHDSRPSIRRNWEAMVEPHIVRAAAYSPPNN
jgi:hypothetical protein